MPVGILPSFSRGELDPALHGRVDTAIFHIGLAIARNMQVIAGGSISNRPGRPFIGPVKDHTKLTLVLPFSFSDDDTHVLEVGNLYMRFIRQDAHTLDSATVINIEGATNASPVVVTATGHSIVNDDHVFIDGVVGMKELNKRFFIAKNVAADTFELNDQVTDTAVDGTGFGTYTSGGSVGSLFEIATPYLEADLRNLKFVQSGDVMTITHPSYDPRELKRLDNDDWTLTRIKFNPDQTAPVNVAAVQNGATGAETVRYKVTAEDKNGVEESLSGQGGINAAITGITKADPAVVSSTLALVEGDEVFIAGVVGMTELNDRSFIARNVNSGVSFELEDEDSTEHTAYSSAGTATLMYEEITDGNATLSAANNISITWNDVADVGRYVVYKQENGLYGFMGETEVASFTDDGSLSPNFDISPPKPKNPFSGPDKRPGAVSLYEQRRVFGGSNDKPDVSVFSVTGSLSNLSISSPAQATDAITAKLTGLKKSQIKHYVPLKSLLTFTSGQEWRIDAGENVGFAFDTIRQEAQTERGASDVTPTTINNTVIYVQGNGKVVRRFGFSLDIDGFTGSNISLLSAHLFRNHTIVDAAHAKGQDDTMTFVRSDGQVAYLTFEEDQQVVAWTLWDTRNGKDESATAVQPSPTETQETFYFVCKRVIGANTVRYIERVASRDFTDVRDAFFVDSGVTVDDPKPITGITAANPVVVTVTGHPFVDGDQVDLNDIEWIATEDEFGNLVQPDQLNKLRFTVRNPATNTFELEDEIGNAVDGTAFDAYVEGGDARLVVTDVTGLWHLEGETLVGLIDGNVVKNLVVANGEVTPPRKFSRAHVGIPYTSDVETLNLEPQAQDQTIQGRRKHVTKLTVKFDRSRGLWHGPNKFNLAEMAQREFEPLGEPTGLLSGDKSVILPPEWNSNGRMFLRQRDPLPMTILAIIPTLELGDV